MGRPESVGTAAEVGLRHHADDCATRRVSVPEVGLMIDNEVLRGRMQAELDVLGFTGEDADQLVQELNFLSCMLIKATEEGRLNG